MAETITVELTRVMDGVYALGPFRIQRGTKCWRWWHVVKFGPTRDLHGRTKTLRSAVLGIAGAVSEVAP